MFPLHLEQKLLKRLRHMSFSFTGNPVRFQFWNRTFLKTVENVDTKKKNLFDPLNMKTRKTKNETKLQNQNKNMMKNEMLENGASLLITWCIHSIKKRMMLAWIVYQSLLWKDQEWWNYAFKKLWTPLSTTTQKVSPRVTNLSNFFFN